MNSILISLDSEREYQRSFESSEITAKLTSESHYINGNSYLPNRSTTLTSSLLRSTRYSTMPCFLSHGFTEGQLLKKPNGTKTVFLCLLYLDALDAIQFLHILLPAVIIINTCAAFIVV
jgi:hypothetical protein